MSRDFSLNPERVMRLSLLQYTSLKSYLAPEGLLGTLHYSSAVDIWSLGCILIEILSGKTMLDFIKLYSSNANPLHLQFSLRLTGIPTESDIKKSKIATNFRAVLNEEIEFVKENNLVFNNYKEFLPEASDFEIDLLKKIFVFVPQNRISAKQILEEIKAIEEYEPILQNILQEFPLLKIKEKKLKNTSKDDIYEQMLDFIEKMELGE